METELMQYIYALIGAILGGLATLLLQNFLPSYVREKGKNLATKEDIESITQKIESIKTEYLKQVETHKSQLWQDQQKYLWAQEEAKLKIDTFKKAIIDVARLINLVKKYQLLLSERELALAAAGISKAASDDASHKLYLEKCNQFAEQANLAFSAFKDVLVEMGGLYALFSIYFTSELSSTLTEILALANRDVAQKMTFEEISKRLQQEYETCGSLDAARERVGRHYDSLCSSSILGMRSQHFFDLLKIHVSSLGELKRSDETKTQQ